MAELLPNWMQELCYTAQLDRLMLGGLNVRRGVVDVGAGSLEVTSGGAGLNLSVAQGGVWIRTPDDDRGPYFGYNDAPVTVTAGANASGNPRIDTVVARIYDSTFGEGADEWKLEIIPGTPQAGAQISDRYTPSTFLDGAADLTGENTTVLAYILVPSGFAGPFVDATHILDARVPAGDGLYVPFDPILSAPIDNPQEAEFRYNRVGDMVTVEFTMFLAADASTNTLTIDTPLFLPARVPPGNLNYNVCGSVNYYNAASGLSVNAVGYLDNADFFKFAYDGTGDFTGPTAVNDYFTGTLTYETSAN